MPFSHWKAGSGLILLDEETLAPVGKAEQPPRFPSVLTDVRSDFPGMNVSLRGSGGKSPEGTMYLLRWEALGANRDRPRKKPWPENGDLVLYQLRKKDVVKQATPSG